ncbi:MAG: GAF domain-containing sensor histidine kinase [Campylobacterales bacterium]|nr:GAF domain-containing sensor histidine kinase [Campylobacterales bacterium]
MHNDSRFYLTIEKKTGYVAKNCIVVPFKNSHDEVIGALQILNKSNGNEDFTQKDLELIEFLVSFTTNILNSLFLDFQINKIFEYTAKISDETDTEKLLVMLTNMGKDILKADRATIWLYDEQKDILWTKVAHGVDRLENSSTTGIVGETFKLNNTIICNNPYEDSRFNKEIDEKTGYKTNSIIAISLKGSDNRVIGVFQCINKKSKKSEFLYSDITRIKIIGSYLANTLERSSLLYKNEFLEKRVAEEISKRVSHERIMIQNSKMAEMGNMMEAIIHQWKQPISATSFVCDVSISFINDNSLTLDSAKKNFQTIYKNITSLTDIINDFRNFFKPDKEKKEFFVVELLEKVAKAMSHHLMSNSADLEIHGDKNLMTVGYPNEIMHVAINIINNALDAISSNKNLNIERACILINVERYDSYIVISISDNGGGIPDEIMKNMFQAYNTSKGEKGTGIGLVLAKTIIEEHHNGLIEAFNINGGAEFKITLPIVEI